jgi:hypothetical protein
MEAFERGLNMIPLLEESWLSAEESRSELDSRLSKLKRLTFDVVSTVFLGEVAWTAGCEV